MALVKEIPLVSVVIGNYNGKQFLMPCLESVFNSTYKNFEIILVDDGSDDGSDKLAERKYKSFKNFKIVRKPVAHSGAASTRNYGAKAASGEYIAFLDNDTQVDPKWIDGLVSAVADKNVGGAQSMLFDYINRNRIQTAGVKLIPYTAWGVPRAQGELISEKWKNQEPIVAVTAGSIFKRELFEKIGYFDEALFAFVSDLEFSWRAWIAGKKIILAPESKVYHLVKDLKMRKVMNEDKKMVYFHLCKNSIRTIVKNYEFRNAVKYLLWSISINVLRAVLVLVRRGDTTAIHGTVKGILWNIFHISDTLKLRSITQKTRKNSDEYIMKKIMILGSPYSIYTKYFKQTKLI